MGEPEPVYLEPVLIAGEARDAERWADRTVPSLGRRWSTVPADAPALADRLRGRSAGTVIVLPTWQGDRALLRIWAEQVRGLTVVEVDGS